MIGVRFMIDGDETEGRLSLVEHPMPPRALAAPLHRHLREDEYSYVLEGTVGALLGDEVHRSPGRATCIFKPRNQWHTFWNAGDEPARILEIISPAGLRALLRGARRPRRRVERRPARARPSSADRYGLEMQPDSIPGLDRALRPARPG